jgi:D-alanyl-D-alanine dipeptidase
MAQRPWFPIPILDCGEPLQPLPPQLWRLEPHPYRQAGAPYGEHQSPFALRSGVVQRLLTAQALLQQQQPCLRLAIFDGWRPLEVQQFMVDFSIETECRTRGVDPRHSSAALACIVADVNRLWAPPSNDPATPPPHSTGAAVDLTLADQWGEPLAMGGAIDAIGPLSEPDHYAGQAIADPQGPEASWHDRRLLLRRVMTAAGFVQHPHEWWHFSHGDQLWAWRSGVSRACYGRLQGGSDPAGDG